MLLVIAAAGCGSGVAEYAAQPLVAPKDGPAAAGKAARGTPDCAKLVTVDEASRLFGKPAGAPTGGINATGGSESFCDWSLADENDTSEFVLLQVQAFDGDEYLPRSGYEAGQTEDVSVPGATEAFVVKEHKDEAHVNLAVRGKRLSISFTPGDKRGDDHLGDVIKLAASAAARVNG